MKRNLIQLVVMVVAVGLSIGSSAMKESKEGKSAIRVAPKKHVPSSIKYRQPLLRKCRSGQPRYCYYLAQLYIKYGHYNQARKWYKAGCSFGGASSCYRLGKFLLSGRGGELNVELAFEYFRQACALRNYRGSCHMLAIYEARREAKQRAIEERRKACALYGLPETATDAEIHQAYLAEERRKACALYGLPETATDAEIHQAREKRRKAEKRARSKAIRKALERFSRKYSNPWDRNMEIFRRANRLRAMRLKRKRAQVALKLKMVLKRQRKRLRATVRRNKAKIRRRCRGLKPVCMGKYIHIRNRTSHSRDVTLCYFGSAGRYGIRWWRDTTYAIAHTTTRSRRYVSCRFHYIHVCGCN